MGWSWRTAETVLAVIASALAARVAFGIDVGMILGLVVAAGLLVLEARRVGLPWHRAILGGATLIASTPHADLSPQSLATATGVAIAVTNRARPVVFVGALIVTGAGVVATPIELVEAWPWMCPPRRLGTAMPLAAVAVGLYGMTLAVRPPTRDALATLVTRTLPLAAGIVVAWLGTWRPPRPPLYNLPSGLAAWGLTAGLVGLALHLSRGGRPAEDTRLATALALMLLAVMATRVAPLTAEPPCGQLLAPLGLLWLLALALLRVAASLPRPRVVDVALTIQVGWMASFTAF